MLPERVEQKISRGIECWEWQGALDHAGYGRVWMERNALAHRVVYEALVGPIPTGLTLDHLCRNPRCVNPSHLEAVSMRENILRGEGPVARNARRTRCDLGHLLTREGGYRERRCWTCKRNRDRGRDHAAERRRRKAATPVG